MAEPASSCKPAKQGNPVLKSRIITAVILLLALLLILFALPDGWWIALVVLMVMQGTLEWSKLSGLTVRGSYLYGALTLLIMLALVWSGAQDMKLAHFLIYAVSALLWLMVVPAWLFLSWRVKSPLLMCLTGWAVLIPSGLAMLDLHAVSPWLLLMLMSLVWVADIGAYFAGRRFGKHKLAPGISPGKTWEGVAGGVLGASVYALIVWCFVPVVPLTALLLAVWFWVALAVLGDLFESAIKRQAGVKDSGSLLPGHGGLLDRIDALTSTLPLAAMVILFWQLG